MPQVSLERSSKYTWPGYSARTSSSSKAMLGLSWQWVSYINYYSHCVARYFSHTPTRILLAAAMMRYVGTPGLWSGDCVPRLYGPHTYGYSPRDGAIDMTWVKRCIIEESSRNIPKQACGHRRLVDIDIVVKQSEPNECARSDVQRALLNARVIGCQLLQFIIQKCKASFVIFTHHC
jgi:hypothetical protein